MEHHYSDQRIFPERPLPGPELKIMNDFFNEFSRVVNRFKELYESGNNSEDDWELAKEAAGLLAHHSIHEPLPAGFKVTVPEGVRAETSVNMVVIDSGVRDFTAREIRQIGFGQDGFQIDFRDSTPHYCDYKATYLTVYNCFDISLATEN